jgi:hypothetical protein
MGQVPYKTGLTNAQQNICEYGGAFGVLLSITCLVQHLVVTIPNVLTNSMITTYIIAVCAFLVLALKKSNCLPLLIVSGVFSLACEYLWMKNLSFSLVVLLLFIYHVIIIIAVSIEGIPGKLKQIRLEKLREENEWQLKLGSRE